MRLAYFDFTINFGGAPQSMVHLAERLGKRHEVHMVDAYGRCEPYCRAIEQAGLPHHVLLAGARHQYVGGAGLRRTWSLLRQIPELIRLRRRLVRTLWAIDPDVIWVMNEKSLTFVLSSRRLRRIPIAHAVRGWGTPDQVSHMLRGLFRRRVAAVMAVSTATLEQLRAAGVPEDRLYLISSTIDMQRVQREAREPLAKPLPGTDGKPRILLMSARPERSKGHEAAVRAVARLVRAGRQPTLWLPGKPGTGVGDTFVRSLRGLAAELGVEQHVHFLGWRRDMPRLIYASDICVLPSHSEGLPRSVLEAMLLQRPVIATPVGGVTDVVQEGVTGLLMPVDDDAVLAAHIERLACEPGLKARLVEAAYRHVCTAFDEDAHTRRVEDVLRRISREG
jgi:glycosyltransferase involved in cell wall biosynthesis